MKKQELTITRTIEISKIDLKTLTTKKRSALFIELFPEFNNVETSKDMELSLLELKQKDIKKVASEHNKDKQRTAKKEFIANAKTEHLSIFQCVKTLKKQSAKNKVDNLKAAKMDSFFKANKSTDATQLLGFMTLNDILTKVRNINEGKGLFYSIEQVNGLIEKLNPISENKDKFESKILESERINTLLSDLNNGAATLEQTVSKVLDLRPLFIKQNDTRVFKAGLTNSQFLASTLPDVVKGTGLNVHIKTLEAKKEASAIANAQNRLGITESVKQSA